MQPYKCPVADGEEERAELVIIKDAAGGIYIRAYAVTALHARVRAIIAHARRNGKEVLVPRPTETPKGYVYTCACRPRERGMSFRFTVGGIILLSVTSHLSFCPTG